MAEEVIERKSNAGRPEWVPTPERIEKVKKYAALGMSKQNIARCMGINYMTLNRREKEYSEFCEAMKEGEAEGLAIVAEDLVRNCAKLNVTAQIFYLKCRGKGKWNDDENLRLLAARMDEMEKKNNTIEHKDSDHGEETESSRSEGGEAPGSSCT